MKSTNLLKRSEVAKDDKWDLSSLFESDEKWEEALSKFIKMGSETEKYKEAFEKPQAITADVLLKALNQSSETQRLGEKLYSYAMLNKSSDEGDSKNTDRIGRVIMAFTDLSAKTSWFIPSIMQIPEQNLRKWIDPKGETGEAFKDHRVYIEKMLYEKPFILSDKEERILSLLSESQGVPQGAFSQLTNVDMDFGYINDGHQDKKLTQSSYSQFLASPDRNIREKAYKQFYSVFDGHKNTISSLYAGRVQQNIALAKIRGYSSAIERALQPDKVPLAVYENLIQTVHKNLEPLHKYYALMKKTLKVDKLKPYDVYVPLVDTVKKVTPYDEAVEIVTEAVAILGDEYVSTLRKGLTEQHWVDKYENVGKRSGAFSAGVYDGYPYILLNYKEDVLRDLFTLIHEGGHSMHSWYSTHNNPYPCYGYTIFEAEVASTFNEELLFRYLLKNAEDDKMKAYLLSMRAGDVLATLYRQTMFAEFEKIAHDCVEKGQPLTLSVIREEYGKLLRLYFGSEMEFEPNSDLEALRIPHFYNSFYVYKYATGISASMALAERVSSGGAKEREDYFNFLKSGGSRYPIESLKVAGVDMATSEPIQAACNNFAKIVTELEEALKKI
ncbi:MAG: oligoendopeptidase F [Treponema sp.]